tara:strand:- start:37 stop:282 length:246 start_codon:yes stop_codon:yes gene_type:complete
MTKKDKENALKKASIAMQKKMRAMNSLTQDQLITIQNTHKIIGEVLQNIKEIDDLYLSDIRNLETSFWKLKHEFLLEDNNG